VPLCQGLIGLGFVHQGHVICLVLVEGEVIEESGRRECVYKSRDVRDTRSMALNDVESHRVFALDNPRARERVMIDWVCRKISLVVMMRCCARGGREVRVIFGADVPIGKSHPAGGRQLESLAHPWFDPATFFCFLGDGWMVCVECRFSLLW
jgi:hypothetical protein